MAQGLMSVRVVGAKQVIRNMKAAGRRGRRAVGAGIYGFAGNVMTKSQKECPVDSGAMKGSGFVTLPTVGIRAIQCEAGYGGPSKAYVVRQHEDLTINHHKKTSKGDFQAVGKAKFLQDPVEASTAGGARQVASIARRAFNDGSGASGGQHPTNPWEGGQ